MTIRIVVLAMLLASSLPLEATAYRIFFDNNKLEEIDGELRQTVEVRLDTEGESNIQLLSVGVKFELDYLAYDRGRSLTGGTPSPYPGYSNYILYSGGRSTRVMEPRIPIAGGETYHPPKLLLPHQVNVNWIEVGLGGTIATATNVRLATLAFEHTAPPPIDGELSLTLTEGGVIFQLGDNSNISRDVKLGPNVPVLENRLPGFGLIFPRDGAEPYFAPPVVWDPGPFRLFYVITFFHYAGFGHWPLVFPSARSELAIPDDWWSLLEKDSPSYWMVVGIDFGQSLVEASDVRSFVPSSTRPLRPACITLNEIKTSVLDEVEIHNSGELDQDMSGWAFHWHDGADPPAQGIYRFPNGFILPAGGYVQLLEYFGYPWADTQEFLVMGSTMSWRDRGGNSVAAEIWDPQGRGVDFMKTSSNDSIPKAPGEWNGPGIDSDSFTLGRVDAVDDDTASDWASLPWSQRARNPGQPVGDHCAQ